jgi:hypothetical protein
MFDFIFAVADPIAVCLYITCRCGAEHGISNIMQWHRENMIHNSEHYSSLLSPTFLINLIQVIFLQII